MRKKATLRVCSEGHRYYKSSDCPVCPVCEKNLSPGGFLALISAPARRALEKAGLTSLEKLSEKTEAEILSLHGIGPTALPKLRQAMTQKNLAFRNDG